jgi:hypothetical protein
MPEKRYQLRYSFLNGEERWVFDVVSMNKMLDSTLFALATSRGLTVYINESQINWCETYEMKVEEALKMSGAEYEFTAHTEERG